MSTEHIRTVTEERIDEATGRNMLITRTIKSTLKSIPLSSSAALRRKTASKFGDAADDGNGPSPSTTILAEPVPFALGRGKNWDLEDGTAGSATSSSKIVVGESKLLCRFCKGDHWSTKCPFKDTLLNTDNNSNANPLEKSATEGNTTKYIPPSQRAGGAKRPDSDHNLTVRITNLSDMCLDVDLNDLVAPFGSLSRTFLAKDRESGLCKGFAFVTYYDRKSCEDCIAALDGFPYASQILRAEWAKPSDK